MAMAFCIGDFPDAERRMLITHGAAAAAQ